MLGRQAAGVEDHAVPGVDLALDLLAGLVDGEAALLRREVRSEALDVLMATGGVDELGRARRVASDGARDAPGGLDAETGLPFGDHLRHRGARGRRTERPADVGTARGVPRLLAMCDTEPMSEEQARQVGVLAGKAAHDDIVDVTVVEGAIRRRDAVVTSNEDLIRRVADAARVRLRIERI